MTKNTIVALATPAGQGAIGVIRLSGPDAASITGSLAQRSGFPARRPVLSWVFDGEEPLDRVLITRFPAGASYTGEELVEVSTHGSRYVLERTLELCVQAGARLAEPGEFTHRAFLSGRMDLAQAEAVCDLIAARTRLSNRAAVRQLEGGLSRRVGELRGRLLDIATDLEAVLDHPDEDIILAGDVAGSIDEARDALRSLVSGFSRGRLLREGAQVAIAGRPNAGKSSLFNALLSRDRSIVHESAGTTRDTLSESCDLLGLPAVLTDTAGLHEAAASPIEVEGMSRTRAAVENADLVLAVLDRSEPAQDQLPFLEELRLLAPDAPRVAVLNKGDLPPASGWEGSEFVVVSASTGAGVAELAELVKRTLEPAGEDSLVTSERHAQALSAAAEELGRARSAPTTELSATLVRRALSGLDSIVCADSSAEVLDGIFSKFCVGK